MHCTISTRSPWPTARNAVPSAHVVLPLPGPVYTIKSPLSSGIRCQPQKIQKAKAFLRRALEFGDSPEKRQARAGHKEDTQRRTQNADWSKTPQSPSIRVAGV